MAGVVPFQSNVSRPFNSSTTGTRLKTPYEFVVIPTVSKEPAIREAKAIFRNEGPDAAAIYLNKVNFTNTRGKRGQPYLDHPNWVADHVLPQNRPVGRMHDFCEDLTLHKVKDPKLVWTFDDVSRVGFCDFDVSSMQFMTKKPGQPYGDFIVDFNSAPPDIRAVVYDVKGTDRDHHMKPEHLTHLTDAGLKQAVAKYSIAGDYSDDVNLHGTTKPGTSMPVWMATKPRGMQDWDFVERETSLGRMRKAEAESTPLPLPGMRNRILLSGQPANS